MRLPLHFLAAPAVAVLLAAGCSSPGAADNDVATLSEGGDVAASADEGTTELTEEAGLEFAQCMRDNGVDDFADPTVDGDGNVTFGGGLGGAGGGGAGADREAQQAARETCGDLFEGVTLGGGRGNRADNTELQDALVNYTECLRDEGLDVGDIESGARPDAGTDPAEGGPPAGGGGQEGRGGRGQDPSAFIADQLGLDTEDPEVSASLEVCQPLLDEAFTNFGPGAGDN